MDGSLKKTNSARSEQSNLSSAVEKAKINPFAREHAQGHSFAINLFERDTDVFSQNFRTSDFRACLGQNDVPNRSGYTHITIKGGEQIKSPLDQMDLGQWQNHA